MSGGPPSEDRPARPEDVDEICGALPIEPVSGKPSADLLVVRTPSAAEKQELVEVITDAWRSGASTAVGREHDRG